MFARSRARSGPRRAGARSRIRFGSGQIDSHRSSSRRRRHAVRRRCPCRPASSSSWKCRCGSQPPFSTSRAEHADLVAGRDGRPRLAAASCDEVAVEREERHAVVGAWRRITTPPKSNWSRPHLAALDDPVQRGAHRLARRLPDVDAEVDGAPLARVVGRERLAAVPAAALQVPAGPAALEADHVRRRRERARGRRRRAPTAPAGSRRRRGSGSARCRPTPARAGRPARGSAPARSRGTRCRAPRAAGRRRAAPTSRAACGSGRRAAPARPGRSGDSSW